MDKHEKEKRIAALLREREGYVAKGLKDRIAAVDEDLKRWGHTKSVESARTVPPQGRSARPTNMKEG